RAECDALDGALRRLQQALIAVAARHRAAIMPGYTHLQRAQPILLAHHLLAYREMLARDRGRLRDCRARADELPLGAGALAGAGFPIDRRFVARQLGFRRVSANSVDAVADRDAAAEFLAAAAIAAVHLSRLAEEIVLWASEEFGFVKLPDAFATGSSMMPQKKNPDVAELVRGKAGRTIGALVALLNVLKGLPLAYNRDLQDDSAPPVPAPDARARAPAHSPTVGGPPPRARRHRAAGGPPPARPRQPGGRDVKALAIPLALLLLCGACGRKSRPVAPELVRPRAPATLAASSTPEGVPLTWLPPLQSPG